MLGKADDRPKVRVTSKGAKYVDANELFQRPRVRQFVKSVKDIEKKPKASQEVNEESESTKN